MTDDELYLIVKENYERINTELSDLNQRVKPFGIFQNDYENWKRETKEWRNALCKKIDVINTKIEKLPCSEHNERYKVLDSKVTLALWLFGLVFTGWIGFLISHQYAR